MRAFVSLLAVLSAALALGACHQAVEPVTSDDMSLGSPTAKVTVVEYASVACPVCAKWNNETYPGFKKTFIDTGRVHYVLREMLTHDPQVAALGFLTARCAGKDKYFQVVDDVFKAQDEIFAGEPRMVMLRIAKKAGLSDAQFDACTQDDKAILALQNRVDRYVKTDKINNTPTFVVNGQILIGDQPLSALGDAITKAAAGAKPATGAKPST